MIRKNHTHTIDFIFPLAVLFVFAVSAFTVLLLSAHTYTVQTQRTESNYQVNTPLFYIRQKIRQNDTAFTTGNTNHAADNTNHTAGNTDHAAGNTDHTAESESGFLTSNSDRPSSNTTQNSSLSTGTLDGQDCLILKNEDGCTYIYAYKGKLKELYIRNDVEAHAKDGKDILEVKYFQIQELDSGLFRISCQASDGSTQSAIFSERSSS